MAKIKIKTDKVEINLTNVKTNEFNGAWQWVMDVLKIMNGGKTEEPTKDIEDDMPFDAFNFKGYEIQHNAAGIIDAMKVRASLEGWEEKEKYDARGGEPKETFDKICNEYTDRHKSYLPEEAARLTGKICARFFLEQSMK